MDFLAQATPPPDLNLWNAPSGSVELYMKIGIAFVLGLAMLWALLVAPPRFRRPIIRTVTFLAGGFWMLEFLWPRIPETVKDPQNFSQAVSRSILDADPIIGNFSNVLSALLLGLGIYSLVSIHGKRLFRRQSDWMFSLVLLISLLVMAIFGYADWLLKIGPNGSKLADQPTIFNLGRDFLFDGILQPMDAAMFSMIAFFIFSAAYRAFRIRSVESSILLGTALIVMLSLMGVVVVGVDNFVSSMAGGSDGSFIQNFKLSSISFWITDTVQTPAIRGVEFGVGVGALAMALRIWLSLERTGISST